MNDIKKSFQTYWNPYVALITAGILSALYFAFTGAVWAVTEEFTRLGGEMLQIFGMDLSSWAYFNRIGMEETTFTRPSGWIVWGMFAGALIMVLCNNNFKIRLPQQKRRYIQGLIGGIIAGFGARLALGCNLAAFFTGVPQFSLHSWIFIIATGLGTFLGTKVVQIPWWKGKPTLMKGSSLKDKTLATSPRKIQPVIGAVVAVLYLLLIGTLVITGHVLLGIAAFFGGLFGIIIERGQICFTAAFRDLWIMGRSVMAKAIIAGMAISSIVTGAVILFYDIPPVTQVAALSTLVGGTLFGIGIVLASSCETGMMYRLMEGQVLYITVLFGNIIGSVFLAFAWDHLGVYQVLVARGNNLNLIPMIGPGGAVTLTLVMLIIAYFFITYKESNQLQTMSLEGSRAK